MKKPSDQNHFSDFPEFARSCPLCPFTAADLERSWRCNLDYRTALIQRSFFPRYSNYTLLISQRAQINYKKSVQISYTSIAFVSPSPYIFFSVFQPKKGNLVTFFPLQTLLISSSSLHIYIHISHFSPYKRFSPQHVHPYSYDTLLLWRAVAGDGWEGGKTDINLTWRSSKHSRWPPPSDPRGSLNGLDSGITGPYPQVIPVNSFVWSTNCAFKSLASLSWV